METINIAEIFNELDNINKEDTKFNEICINVAKATINKDVTIHIIVENLGSLLVNPIPEKRELGTLVLSETLENLPNDFLTSTELHFISTFYADRLKDNHQVIPAVLRGILALVQMQNIPEGAPHKLLTALFENVPCQQQQLKDRQHMYNIFKELLNRRTTEMKALGMDFVLGVIQSMDGERDPRNLFLLFNWLPQFLTTVTLGHLTEEMFDVMSCYFPVDFRTPSQDPNAITRDDLASSLCPCLCAVPAFAEFCMPLIIDKLNSSLKIAKYDSLNLLAESCKVFDVSIYEQHSHDIWDCLQKETLNSNDSDIEEAGLNAISAIVNKLAQSENNSFFKQTLSNLYDSLKGNLRPDTKLFLSSSKILLAVARASQQSCTDIVQPTVALLLNQFNLTKDSSQQEILFRTLIEFVIAYIKIFEVTNILEIKVLEEIPILCLQNILNTNPEIRVISLESLAKIAKTLPKEVRNNVYCLLKDGIISPEPENVRNSLLKCFKTFSKVYQIEILDLIQSSTIDLNNIDTLQLYLEALCTIVSEKTFAQIILPQILDQITNNNLTVSKISVDCLRKLLEENCDNKNIQNYLYFDCKIINRIMSWTLVIIKENKSDFNLLENISTIIKIVVGFQPKEQQELITKTFLNELLLNYKSNGQVQDKIIIILEGLLLRLRPEVEISEKYQLILELLQVSPIIQENIYLYACMLIANLINKCSEDDNFLNILNEIENYVATNLENPLNDLHNKNLIQLISWITKSLIIRGSNKSDVWTDKLISLLDKYEDAGKSFRLIMDDSHDCLSKKSFCTNRLLYRQKFFAYVCKKLSSSYDETKPNHLIALGYLLQLAPQQVIILYFKELSSFDAIFLFIINLSEVLGCLQVVSDRFSKSFSGCLESTTSYSSLGINSHCATLRLLVFCLELCREPDVLCAVLNTLNTLILTKESYLENHIDDFIPRFLNLTKFQPSMKVRIAALNCIKELPSAFPVYKLLPHKQEMVFGLTASLDDKKRLVRRQAVDARSRWFLLDAPT